MTHPAENDAPCTCGECCVHRACCCWCGHPNPYRVIPPRFDRAGGGEVRLRKRAELVQPLRDHNHPHTQGLYDGLNYAIGVLERRGKP